MEIPTMESLTDLNHALVRRWIDTAVLDKANDIAKARGEMTIRLLDAAAAASPGETDLLQNLDVIA